MSAEEITSGFSELWTIHLYPVMEIDLCLITFI